ncbi:MAG: hypothetical protein R2710_18340 [Acidimicrobiales bacterium]
MLGTIIISVAIAAVLGVTSRSRRWIGRAGFAAFGVVGALAIGVDAQGGWLGAIVTSVAAVAAGVGALELLLGRLQSASSSPSLRPARRRADRRHRITNQPGRWTPVVPRRDLASSVCVAVAGGRGIAVTRWPLERQLARTTPDQPSRPAPAARRRTSERRSTPLRRPEVASTPGITPIVIAARTSTGSTRRCWCPRSTRRHGPSRSRAWSRTSSPSPTTELLARAPRRSRP